MGRPRGAKSKRTILREAEEQIDRANATNQVHLDSIFVIERAMEFFFVRAERGRVAGRCQQQVGDDYKQAAALAALAAPYRHARLKAVTLAGDPNNPVRFKDNATADELREEIMRRLAMMREAGILDLEALPPPKRE